MNYRLSSPLGQKAPLHKSGKQIKVLLAIGLMAIATSGHAFRYKLLEFDRSELTEMDEGPELTLHIKAARHAAVQSCKNNKGEIGTIGKRVVCRMPDSTPSGQAASRKPPPGSSPPPTFPTEEEAKQFVPLKPTPTRPPIPTAEMVKPSPSCPDGQKPPCNDFGGVKVPASK